MTKEQKRLVKTGILFVIIIFITIWGINYIKSNDLITSKTRFYGVYSNVKELSEGNHVYLNGTKIGKVVNVDFEAGNLNKLIVEFHIRNDIQIPDSSVALITSTDIMGTKGLDIIINKRTKTFHKSGDTLLTRVEATLTEEVNKQILPLKIKTESMIGTLDSLLVAFRSVFNPKTRSNIKQSFQSIQLALENLENTSVTLDTLMTSEKKRISMIIKNAESITSNIEENNESIERILTNVEQISDSVAASNLVDVIKNADSAIGKLNSTLTKIDKGEGTLGLLIKDDDLYNKLNSSADDLDKLIKDIKENPDRYVHISLIGRSDKKSKKKADTIPDND
jgi:phospholipid/cholesterol/gamma-HCH transport system substrate-binding protein